MLDPSKMSVTELLFIHTYVKALRRDYDLLSTVMHVSHPDVLDLKDIVAATRFARRAHRLQDEFEDKLFSLPRVTQLPRYRVHSGPTIEQLAAVFALSFFKLIKVHKTNVSEDMLQDNGWFSGEPAKWKTALMVMKDLLGQAPPKKPLPNELLTTCIQMLNHFFGGANFTLNAEKKFPTKSPKKMWPPPAADAALDWDSEIEDDDDDDIDTDDLMNWWFK